jgi:RecB family exonuclease
MSEAPNLISFTYEQDLPADATPEKKDRIIQTAIAVIKNRFEQETGLDFDTYGKQHAAVTTGIIHFSVTQNSAPPGWVRPVRPKT